MSDAYKIIHNFMAFIASPDLKNKVWTWLLDPSGKQRKEEALLQIWDEYRPEADAGTRHSLRKFQKKSGAFFCPAGLSTSVGAYSSYSSYPVNIYYNGLYICGTSHAGSPFCRMYRSQGRAKTDHVTGWFDHHPEFGIHISISYAIYRRYPFCISFRRRALCGSP